MVSYTTRKVPDPKIPENPSKLPSLKTNEYIYPYHVLEIPIEKANLNVIDDVSGAGVTLRRKRQVVSCI